MAKSTKMPKSLKRSRPSPRLGEPPDGTIVRASLDSHRWFYAHKWKEALIIYFWSGSDDLAIDDVICLPVAFRIHGDMSFFWISEWRQRAEIVGSATPSKEAQDPEEWADPDNLRIIRWSGSEGFTSRSADFSEMHGMPKAIGYITRQIADRLRTMLTNEPWNGIRHVDASRWYIDKKGTPQMTIMPRGAAMIPSLSSFHPFEFHPEAPEWTRELASLDTRALLERLTSHLDLEDGYIDRDIGGPAMLAAIIVAISHSPELTRNLKVGPELTKLAGRLNPKDIDHLVILSRSAVKRIRSAQSDLGDTDNSPINAATVFKKAIAQSLDNTFLP